MRHQVTIDPSSGYEDIEAAIAELEAKLHTAKRKATAEPAESDSLIVPAVTTIEDDPAAAESGEDKSADEDESASDKVLSYNCSGVGDVTVGDKDPRAAQRRAI